MNKKRRYKKMNYSGIEWESLKNGYGCRVVLFVSGCEHHCNNCQNPETWNPSNGAHFSDSVRESLIGKLGEPYIDGITYSGGDPLYKSNYNEVLKLAEDIRKKFPNKTQWLYTGYSTKEVWSGYRDILQYLDVIVTEKYEYSLPRMHWAGSSNQYVIDLNGEYPELTQMDEVELVLQDKCKKLNIPMRKNLSDGQMEMRIELLKKDG